MNKEYYVKVADLMRLPKPRKKLTDSTGDELPLITVTVGLWSTVTWVQIQKCSNANVDTNSISVTGKDYECYYLDRLV